MVLRGGPVPRVDFCFSKACFCSGQKDLCHTSVEFHSVMVSKVLLDAKLSGEDRADEGFRIRYLEMLPFWNQDNPCPEEGNRLLGDKQEMSKVEIERKKNLLPTACLGLELNTAHWMGDTNKICHALVIRVNGYAEENRNKTMEEVAEELLALGFLAGRVSSTVFRNVPDGSYDHVSMSR